MLSWKCFICLGTHAVVLAGNSIPYDQISQRVAVVEYGDPDNPPELPAFADNAFVFTFMANTRGFISAGNTASAGGVSTNGEWKRVIIMKLAIIAFLTGNVLPPPAATSPIDMKYLMMFGDECMDFDNTSVCSAPYATTKFSDMMWGSLLENRSLPPSKAAIAALMFPEHLAQLAAVRKMPMIGWNVDRGKSDKDEFPSLFRVVPPTHKLYRALGLTLRMINNYTKIDMSHCDDQRETSAMAREIFLGLGIQSIMAVFWPKGQFNLAPPSMIGDEELTSKYARNVKQMKDNNAHAHVQNCNDVCPAYDIHSYLAMSGLMGPGHFWTGMFIHEAYKDIYLPILQSVGIVDGRFLSPYAFVMPYDGYLQAQTTKGRLESAFDTWIATLEDKKDILFEPWLLKHMLPGDFANFTNVEGWYHVYDKYHLFDTAWALLLAVNSLANKTGSIESTPEALMEEVASLDFEGLSGRIRFDENNNVYPSYDLSQWRYKVRNMPATTCYINATTGAYDLSLVSPQCIWPSRAEVTRVATFTDADVIHLLAPLTIHGGGSELPPDENKVCPLGTKYNVAAGQCELCPPGEFSDKTNQVICDPCPPGFYSGQAGTGICRSCLEGTFAAAYRSTACTECAAGRFTSEPHQAQCYPCNVGRYALVGAKDCSLCVAGEFQNHTGQSSCQSCNGVYLGTISIRGANSSDGCFCTEGQYYRPGGFGCTTCSEGLSCPPGRNTPTQNQGYYAEALDAHTRHYDVFECVKEDWCPVGVLGTCRNERTARSCAQVDGVGCPWYVPLLGLPFLCVVMHIMYVISNNGTYQKINALTMLAGNLGIAVGAMQALNVYSFLYSEVPLDLANFFNFASVFMLRIQSLWPECSIGQSFMARLSLSMLPPLVILGVNFILYLLTLVLSCTPLTKWFPVMRLNTTWNSVGLMLQMLYIMQCKDAFGYFSSKPNPCGKQTLQDYSDVIFWSITHLSAGPVITAVYLLSFYVVGTYSVMVYIAVIATRYVHRRSFWTRWRFIFSRWRPECRFWGCIMLFRNMCIALVPMVVRTDDMTFRIVVFVVLLLAHALAEAYFLPWFVYLHNMCEIVISVLICLIAIMGMAFHDSASDKTKYAAAWVISFFFIIVWIVTVLSFFYAVRWNQASRMKQRSVKHREVCDALLRTCADTWNLIHDDEAIASKWRTFAASTSVHDMILIASMMRLLHAFEDDDPMRCRFRTSNRETKRKFQTVCSIDLSSTLSTRGASIDLSDTIDESNAENTDKTEESANDDELSEPGTRVEKSNELELEQREEIPEIREEIPA